MNCKNEISYIRDLTNEQQLLGPKIINLLNDSNVRCFISCILALIGTLLFLKRYIELITSKISKALEDKPISNSIVFKDIMLNL